MRRQDVPLPSPQAAPRCHPKSQVVPDPHAQPQIQGDQLILFHVGDFCLLRIRHKTLQQAHRRIDRCRQFDLATGHRASPFGSPTAAPGLRHATAQHASPSLPAPRTRTTAIFRRLLVRVLAIPPRQADSDLGVSRIQRHRAGRATDRLNPHLADDAAIAVTLVPLDPHLFLEHQVAQVLLGAVAECLRLLGCVDTGRRILCCTLSASRTVTVSPSATPTTRPVMVSAWQASVQQASASAAANGLILKM